MVWNYINQKLQENIKVVFLVVLESIGSSPGRQGFKMAVAADGSMFGSIGGGIMEHKFVQMVKSKLEGQQQIESRVHRQVHKSNAPNKSGMICSGEQTLFIHEINNNDLPHVQGILSASKNNNNSIIEISPKGIAYINEKADFDFFYEEYDDSFIYRERTGFKNELHIIGGGHCGLALSTLMSKLDFHIKIYDDRHELNTMVQNDFAHESFVLNGYEDLKDLIKEGKNVFVIIMTFGYRTDAIALKALKHKNYKYLGMLGSVNKIDKMLEEFKLDDFSSDWLSLIKTPAGLPIKSKTPEEIAISIAAEIIKIKNAD